MRRLLLCILAVLACLPATGGAEEFPHNPIVTYRDIHFPGEGILSGTIIINNYDYIDYILTINHGNADITVTPDYNGMYVEGERIRAGEAVRLSAGRGGWTVHGDNGVYHSFEVMDHHQTMLNFIPEGDRRRGLIGMQMYEQLSGGETIIDWTRRPSHGWPPGIRGGGRPPRPAPNPNPYPPYPPRPAPNPNPWEPDDPHPYPPRPAPNPNPWEPDDPHPYPPRPAPNPNPWEPDDPYPPRPAPNPTPWDPPYPAPNPNPWDVIGMQQDDSVGVGMSADDSAAPGDSDIFGNNE